MDKNWNKRYLICLIALLVVACALFFWMGFSGRKASASFDISAVKPQSRVYLTEEEIAPCFEKNLNDKTFPWLSQTLGSVNYKLAYLRGVNIEQEDFYEISKYDDMYLHIENNQILLRTFMQAWVNADILYYNYSYHPRYAEKDGKLLPGIYEISSLENTNVREEFLVTEPMALEDVLYQRPMFQNDYSLVKFSLLDENCNIDYVNAVCGYYNWNTGAISFDGKFKHLPSYAYHRYQQAFDVQRLLIRGGNQVAVGISYRGSNTVNYEDDYIATFVVQEDTPLADLVHETVKGMME